MRTGRPSSVADALAVLAGFGLVQVAGGLVTPLPAAARYAVGAPEAPTPPHEEATP